MSASHATTTPAIHYGGFWRRLVALVIDYLIVSASLFAVFATAAALVPTVADLIDLSSFHWLTVERTLEERPAKTVQAGGETKTETEKIVQSTVAGRWVYVHRVIETVTEKNSGTPATSTESIRLDPTTHLEMSGVSVWSYFWIPWLIYAVLMESSALQATLGKMAIGLKVTTAEGGKPSYPRSLTRNLLKVVSVLTLMIGFMLAGWTRRKQALHDMMAKCLVVAP